jgi:uncharacterized protein DUF5624
MVATSPFVQLFYLYTMADDAIGTHLDEEVARASAGEPLIVVTGSDIFCFRGDGGPPVMHSFRLDTKGFLELAGISHLGPALGSLVTMAQAGGGSWQADAERLVSQLEAVQKANTARFWADLGVPAWAPHLDAIQRMVAYACDLALSFLAGFRTDPSKRTFDALVNDFLEVQRERFPVPFDHVMIATFCLTALNGVSGSFEFLRGLTIDWARALVIFAGKTGGPTAALTRCTNQLQDLVFIASRGAVRQDRVYTNPFAPAPSASTKPADWPAIEAQLRGFWATTYARIQLAGRMFPQYPRFVPGECPSSMVTPATRSVSAPPRLTTAADLFSFVARLRFVMEDPTQLLSGSVASYVLGQLALGKAPADVAVPGLTGVTYPPSAS